MLLDSAALQRHELMRDAAQNAELRDALDDAVAGIGNGMNAIADICKNHGSEPSGKTCKGMRGLINEAESHVFEDDFSDRDVQDAVIIAQAQRMGHYGLAGYGTAAAFAHALGHHICEGILKEHLDNIYGGDRPLTKLAEGTINPDALA